MNEVACSVGLYENFTGIIMWGAIEGVVKDACFALSYVGDKKEVIDFYCGVWLNGTWYDGDFWSGTWMNGIWKDGVWHSGTWHNGSWCAGKWIGGKWKNGIVHKGLFLSGFSAVKIKV